MELADQRDREDVRGRRAEQHRGTYLTPLDAALLLDERHRVVMDGMRHLVADRSGELLGVLDEIEERVGDVDVAARRRERVRRRLVPEIELERAAVVRLGRPRDGSRDRLERLVER